MDEKFITRYFENYATGYDTFDEERLAQFYFAPTHMDTSHIEHLANAHKASLHRSNHAGKNKLYIL